jgi:hypothetical protein
MPRGEQNSRVAEVYHLALEFALITNHGKLHTAIDGHAHEVPLLGVLSHLRLTKT